MSILINGMEMPKEYGRCMVIFPDGRVTTEFGTQVIATAIPVPPHGDLIDADKLVELYDIMADKCDSIGVSIWHQFKATVEWSPIVIPEEEAEE